MKERLSKMKLLEILVAKQAPLADHEEALKKKLIIELMSSQEELLMSRTCKNVGRVCLVVGALRASYVTDL
ncbi:hypothetical protein DY000_02023098 [Brassica cretica]|uniref:Uncharacterized protein n=1 Tax=Brassica cretica TaxID=69181 RepID=A0ABQ7E674_BRACR|nr:hypothetical protein DY000_02023098 [Brassica cretica]